MVSVRQGSQSWVMLAAVGQLRVFFGRLGHRRKWLQLKRKRKTNHRIQSKGFIPVGRVKDVYNGCLVLEMDLESRWS